MPFKSDKQRAYLYSQKPAIAKKFAKHKGSYSKGAISEALKKVKHG